MMNIETEKIRLVKMILDTENPKIIESIKKIFLRESSSDFWDDLTLQQQEEIEKASAEIEEGEITDYEAYIQKHR